MKKFLAVLAIAGTLVACNNDSETTTTTEDTTTIVQPDTMQVITDTTISSDTIGQGVENNPTN